MGKVSIFCVILVFALLLEDGSSVKKKTEEEKKEDEEIQKAVNATLAAEEEKRRQEEKKKEDEAKKKKNDTDKKESGEKKKEVRSQDEACPPVNSSCPTVRPCPEVNCTGQCGTCPDIKPCPICSDKECDECPEITPCQPCQPCLVTNNTEVVQDQPPSISCPEVTGMPTAVAVAVGASAALLAVGVATGVGLLLRYASPIESGFLFVATIIIVWYLCSHHPEAAREMGGRVVAVLREATLTLSNRVVAAIRHHNEQVGFSAKSNLFLRLSSMFHLKILH
jgi:hypothetical protein